MWSFSDRLSAFWRGNTKTVVVQGAIGYGGLFTPGRWVMTDAGVGILTQNGQFGVGVHLVADDGTTLAQIMVAHNSIREAKAAEIPRSRCSLEQAIAKGYSA